MATSSGMSSILLARTRLARYTSLIKPRHYGSSSAAAIQYDDDYYDYYGGDDRTVIKDHNHNNPMVDGEGSEPWRGVQWVVMGEPGAKKHVYAQKLSKLLHVPHISMATLVFQELHPHSSLYNQIKNAVSQGKLVPEDIIFGLLSKRLEEGYLKGETGFILDGIPRTRTQAEILDQIIDVDLVLNFKCIDRVETKLVNGWSLPPQCSHQSHSEEAAQKEKFEQNKPLEDFYRKQKKLLDFQVTEGFGESWQGLLSVLQLQHMKSSFQTLTA